MPMRQVFLKGKRCKENGAAAPSSSDARSRFLRIIPDHSLFIDSFLSRPADTIAGGLAVHPGMAVEAR